MGNVKKEDTDDDSSDDSGEAKLVTKWVKVPAGNTWRLPKEFVQIPKLKPGGKYKCWDADDDVYIFGLRKDKHKKKHRKDVKEVGCIDKKMLIRHQLINDVIDPKEARKRRKEIINDRKRRRNSNVGLYKQDTFKRNTSIVKGKKTIDSNITAQTGSSYTPPSFLSTASKENFRPCFPVNIGNASNSNQTTPLIERKNINNPLRYESASNYANRRTKKVTTTSIQESYIRQSKTKSSILLKDSSTASASSSQPLQYMPNLESTSPLLSVTSDVLQPSTPATQRIHPLRDISNSSPTPAAIKSKTDRSIRIAIMKQKKTNNCTGQFRHAPIPFDMNDEGTSGVSQPRIQGISKAYYDEGDLSFTCSACGAKLWKKETKRGENTKGLRGAFSMCCLKGRIELPEFTKSPPQLLMDLYTNKHPKSKHFIENARQYNMVFAFTSMGEKVDKSINKGKGPYVFRIKGQNCHTMGGLVPSTGRPPKYSQLYIYDTANEAQNRTKAIGGKDNNQPSTAKNQLDPQLIQELMDLLDECNPLVKVYRMARDRFEQTKTPNFKIKLIARRSTDGRNYNLLTVDKVAALIVGDIDLNFDKRDIVVDSQSEGLQRISELHPKYLALQYALLFAYAEDGYRPNIYHREVDGTESRKRKKVTMREFFAYKIQERSVPTLVHMARKLQQQLLVDAYTMVESQRIWYIRNDKRIQRSDTFSNLTHATLNGDVINSMLGTRYKFPASFTGSARYMIKNYRDAMALCRVYGYLDLFITFTCNSKWPEIRRASEGTSFNPEDKPAYQARVFNMKLDRLIEDIRRNKIFGRVKAELYTVEFQKRGLPHIHLCLFFDERDKLPEPEDIDEYISAEIPDKDEDPELYQLGHDLDNGYVIPYNAKLVKKYQAHINVEWCNQVGAIRYVSSCEAVWRILSFDINHRNPTVIRLPFHLPDQHSIIFDKNDLIETVLDEPSVNTSQFLEWMKCNQVNEYARQLTYVESPTKFVWNKDTRLWTTRKRDTSSIGRIHHVSPSTGELFYLRILLNKVKSKKCYEDIRTVNGVLCPNFKATCYEMGLLDDDQEYIDAIKDTSTWGSGVFVRNFFAQLLLSESLSRPEYVIEQTFEYLSADIIHQSISAVQPTTEMLQNIILDDIEKHLQHNGKV
ncbi:uncharacterized protein [Rutidosis leptorrhynchoides]|uniref:uncharacterized protein n=1 Tax=Rutidosis leptorrhynchoides TaxID=125765 RepID=UPI003A999102